MSTNKINVTDLSPAGNSLNKVLLGTIGTTRVANQYAENNALVHNGTGTYVQGIFNNFTGLHNLCSYSINSGASWTVTTGNLPATAAWDRTLIYAFNKFVYVAGTGGTASTATAYSTDGISWTAGTTIANNYWQSIAYGNGKLMAIAFSTTPNLATSTNGTTWATSNLGFSPNYATIVYGNGIWLIMNSSGTLFQARSTNDGGTWTTSTPTFFASTLYFGGGLFFANSGSASYVSADALTWTNISASLQITSGLSSIVYYKGTWYSYGFSSGYLYVYTSSNGYNWTQQSPGTTNALGTTASFAKGPVDDPNILMYMIPNAGSAYGDSYSLNPQILNSSGNSYIKVTATKGSSTLTQTLVVKKSPVATPIYSISALPGSIILNATADGVVVPASLPTTTTFTIYKNGLEQSGWTVSTANDTGLTATISGYILTVTALTTAVDSAYATISATKTGEATLTTKVLVSKNKGSGVSGIVPGASFSAFSTSQTRVYLKFLATGYFQIKYGTGGSYANAGIWINPPNATSPPGGTYYLSMNYTSTTSDVLTAGTNGVVGATWNQMNVDREYYLDNTASGSHIVNVTAAFSTSSTGTTSVVGTGTLRLQVP